jgi:hypothetical protein
MQHDGMFSTQAEKGAIATNKFISTSHSLKIFAMSVCCVYDETFLATRLQGFTLEIACPDQAWLKGNHTKFTGCHQSYTQNVVVAAECKKRSVY